VDFRFRKKPDGEPQVKYGRDQTHKGVRLCVRLSVKFHRQAKAAHVSSHARTTITKKQKEDGTIGGDFVTLELLMPIFSLST
jgi:hypothetical protein